MEKCGRRGNLARTARPLVAVFRRWELLEAELDTRMSAGGLHDRLLSRLQPGGRTERLLHGCRAVEGNDHLDLVLPHVEAEVRTSISTIEPPPVTRTGLVDGCIRVLRSARFIGTPPGIPSHPRQPNVIGARQPGDDQKPRGTRRRPAWSRHPSRLHGAPRTLAASLATSSRRSLFG